MKYIGLAIVGILGAVAGCAVFAASRAPYQAERVMTPPGALICGAGYYNEGYIWLAAVCVVGACVMTVIALDYLKNVRREGSS